MTTRLLTLLNESGDNTIEWESDNDAYMLDFIQRKMDAYRAMKTGNYNAAIVALDYALFPSDAASRTSQTTGAK